LAIICWRFLDLGIEKLLHPAAVQADQVVVVLAFVEFVDRLARLEIAAREQAGLLELHEHAVHGGQADVGVIFQQDAVDVFSRHVPALGVLKDLEDLQSRQVAFRPVLLSSSMLDMAAGAGGNRASAKADRDPGATIVGSYRQRAAAMPLTPGSPAVERFFCGSQHASLLPDISDAAPDRRPAPLRASGTAPAGQSGTDGLLQRPRATAHRVHAGVALQDRCAAGQCGHP
jgi:hypothetical protein